MSYDNENKQLFDSGRGNPADISAESMREKRGKVFCVLSLLAGGYMCHVSLCVFLFVFVCTCPSS